MRRCPAALAAAFAALGLCVCVTWGEWTALRAENHRLRQENAELLAGIARAEGTDDPVDRFLEAGGYLRTVSAEEDPERFTTTADMIRSAWNRRTCWRDVLYGDAALLRETLSDRADSRRLDDYLTAVDEQAEAVQILPVNLFAGAADPPEDRFLPTDFARVVYDAQAQIYREAALRLDRQSGLPLCASFDPAAARETMARTGWPDISWEEGPVSAERNPIDDFFDDSPYFDDGTTAAMNYAAAQRRDAWRAELYHLADEVSGALVYDADRTVVDGYLAAAEEQVERTYELVLFTCSSLEAPLEERLFTSGTIRGVLWAGAAAQVYRDTFFQLRDYGFPGECYEFVFDAGAVRAEMDAWFDAGGFSRGIP